mmetsp:Transcript_1697/g.4902  ORF Transcript_1697/g.4902 Transcript_1697/m.4902 type:complete len:458 (+) Transcript_1697:338-1711(+)|eukprot:CAMPEP_0117672376 /NCGR_PEP_ID=MMETSP0804-20121206/13870_1 /TAXON_ID=1074897 /ORGANISM="Tetraselmis astigmatica, Strain CCMP880" /LENGTH=457 /DNA_ID=CAMNT_0005480971 /DNA_START=292 /DNA_END=1665 /DNA_ORIENTATION=+
MSAAAASTPEAPPQQLGQGTPLSSVPSTMEAVEWASRGGTSSAAEGTPLSGGSGPATVVGEAVATPTPPRAGKLVFQSPTSLPTPEAIEWASQPATPQPTPVAQQQQLQLVQEQPLLSRPKSFLGWEEARQGLLPGDHVYVSCGVYYHHGIYVGDGKFVHKVSGGGSLATLSFSKNASMIGVGGGLIYTGFEDFAPNPSSILHIKQYKAAFHPLDTVDLAFSCLRSQDLYRLLEANCEHFATWCKTGHRSSMQVVAVTNALLQNFAAVSAFVGSIAVFSGFSSLQDTYTEVRHERGRGLSRLLGLGRKTITTTVVAVNNRRVLSAAGVAGLAGAVVYSLARKLKQWLLGQRRRQVALRLRESPEVRNLPLTTGLNPGDAATVQGLDDKVVVVHKWRVSSAEELVSKVHQAVQGFVQRPVALQDLLYYSPEDMCFLPLREEDIRRLPLTTSLKLAWNP